VEWPIASTSRRSQFSHLHQVLCARASGGSGLELYIARVLAEQMGGTVVLKHSAPGQGSTFALRLTAADPRSLPAGSAAGPEE
jgi:signal transduction histidine kinase